MFAQKHFSVFFFEFQVIDFWLLFFLLSTSLNIAVHVLVDRFYQAELRLKDTKKIVDVSTVISYSSPSHDIIKKCN